MSTSYYIYAGIIAAVALFNLRQAKAQKPSRSRTFSLWLNSLAIALTAIALLIALLTH